MKNKLSESIRFLLVGTLNTILGLSVIFISKALFGLNDLLSNIIGYTFGLGISYMLNKNWTFHYSGQITSTAIRFILAFAISYFANLTTVYLLRDYAQLNSYFAQTAGIIPYTIIFYLLSRYMVFPKKTCVQ